MDQPETGNKKNLIYAIVLIIGVIVIAIVVSEFRPKSLKEQKEIPQTKVEEKLPYNMQITSPDFKNNEKIPSRFTCDGEGIAPDIEISDVPRDAKSLALIMDDPDAPSGEFLHWIMWNIKPDTKKIGNNNTDRAVVGKTDAGDFGYTGPCPPKGTHHYRFTLYALDKTLDININSSKSDLDSAMKEHVLDEAILVGLYQLTRI